MDLIYSTSYYVLNYNPISLGFNYLFPTSSSNYINNYQLIRKPKDNEISNYEGENNFEYVFELVSKYYIRFDLLDYFYHTIFGKNWFF